MLARKGEYLTKIYLCVRTTDKKGPVSSGLGALMQKLVVRAEITFIQVTENGLSRL